MFHLKGEGIFFSSRPIIPRALSPQQWPKKIEPKMKANFIWQASREVQQNSTSEP